MRYPAAARPLQPGGHLAIWSATHVFPVGGDPFFDEIQQVYDAIGEGRPPGAPHPAPGELPDQSGQYEHIWRMAYVRGPEGIIVSLAERIG